MKITFKAYRIFFIISAVILFNFNFNVGAQTPALENDVYLISTPQELKWFADHVLSGANDADGKLVSDIDLSSICSVSSENWIPIGTYQLPYSGCFDGNGYQISGLYINDSDTYINYFGLFGFVSGTIKNLSVEGNIISSMGYAGGITGYNEGTIENSSFTGNVQGTFTGGIAADNQVNGLIQNCFTIIDNDGSAVIVPIAPSGRIKNCYYNDLLGDDGIARTTALSTESFYNGKACYLLNGTQENAVWRQNVDNSENNTLPYPGSRYAAVYKTSVCGSEDTYYSNYNIIHHNFENDICSSCCITRISTSYVNLLLNDSIAMKYHITVNDPALFSSDIIMHYSFDTPELNLSLTCSKESEGTYTAVVPCQVTQMGNIIYTKASAENNGEIICTENNVIDYSVLKYSEQILNDQSNLYSSTCKKLILNILKYGYESQLYFNNNDSFKTEILNKFADHFESFEISAPSVENPDMSEYQKNISNPQANIKSAYLTLHSKVCLNIKVDSSVSDISLKAEDSQTGEIRIIPMTYENEFYMAQIQDISAENLLDDFILSVIDSNENIISNTIGYNIENYIYTVVNSSDGNIDKANDICLSLLGYGKAVEDYCNEII